VNIPLNIVSYPTYPDKLVGLITTSDCFWGHRSASGDIGPHWSFIVYCIGPQMWLKHSEKTLGECMSALAWI